MDHLRDIHAFIHVARSGSFKRAGELTAQSSSAVSKAIARLEAHLQVLLFRRSTRHLSLTDEGRQYLEQCEQALALLDTGADQLAASRDAPTGTLRVHASLLWFRDAVLPLLPGFQQRYPAIQLRLVLSESTVDPVSDGYDLVVRVGAPDDSRLVVRRLRATRSMVVASPAYLRDAPPLESLDDLERHHCIRFMTADTFSPARWHFRVDGEYRVVDVPGSLDVSDPQALIVAASAGIGLVQVPDLLAEQALQSGQLQQALTRFQCEGPDIVMVWPHERHMPYRLRVFVDWLQSI